MRIVIWVGFWTFLADQVSKYIVVHWMGLINSYSIEMYPPYLNFRMAWNSGINFGLFSSESELTKWVLIVVALVISAVVLWWMHHEPAGRIGRISAGLLVGGALANVVDRVLYGAVADFINMSCCGLNNPYAFNIADISVFAGAIGLVLFTGGEKAA
ncbi:MAG: signal peptidase II [Rhodobacterales bacterium]|nr:signal peptidase II [Rhodobacterales bacterium]